MELAFKNGLLKNDPDLSGLTVESPRQVNHGDWSTNAAMILAKPEKKAPRDLAAIIIDQITDEEGFFEKDGIEIAGPGFINFTLSTKYWHQILREIKAKGADYGKSELGQGEKVLVEFVSANPTGPLHVGHGRGAALGDVLARILSLAGYSVTCEYYINDVGNQMLTLGRSVLYRLKELSGETIEYGENLYQGDYIKTLAEEISESEAFDLLSLSEEEAAKKLFPVAAQKILDGIKDDLTSFGIEFDRWFSEQDLVDAGLVEDNLDDLRKEGHIYEEGGATWFRSTALGDDKDRPLIKSSGEKTYITSDLAYHRDKLERGYTKLIDIWGADHHGYIPRMKAGLSAMGFAPDSLDVLLVQMVNLLRDGKPVSMSTRAGEFVTLKDVIDEVGSDAARFLFLTRSSNSPLDFDLDLAKSQTAENPVYYVQYAHARITSVFEAAEKEGFDTNNLDGANLSLLKEKEELNLMRHLAKFPDMIEGASLTLEPHRATYYLTELAGLFHPYYNKHRFITDDRALSLARLYMAGSIKQVIKNGLAVMGISAPDKM